MYRFSSRAETRTATRTPPCALISPNADTVAAGGVPDEDRSALAAAVEGAADAAGLLATAAGTGVEVAALSLTLGLMLAVAVGFAAGGGCESLVDVAELELELVGAGRDLEEPLLGIDGGPPPAAGEEALAGALGVGATDGRAEGAGGGCFEGGCGRRLGGPFFVVGGSDGAEVMT